MLFGIYCILLWMILGYVSFWSVVSIHLHKAEKKGYYAIDYWVINGPDIFDEIDNLPISFMVGLLIWPIRLASFISSIPDLYDIYEVK